MDFSLMQHSTAFLPSSFEQSSIHPPATQQYMVLKRCSPQGARQHMPLPATHGNTCPLSAYTELLHLSCSCHSDSCHPNDSRSYWQRFWPAQRSSLSCGTHSSSDLCYLCGSHSLGKFLAAPLSLPRQLSLSSRLLLDCWLSLSPQHCSAHLLMLHPLVGPAADWQAVDPTAATKCETPKLCAQKCRELNNYNLKQTIVQHQKTL